MRGLPPAPPSRKRYVSSVFFLMVMLVGGFASLASAETLLGVYYGDSGWHMQDVRNMEVWQGKKYAVVELFTNFCNSSSEMNNLFDKALVYIWNNHNIPVITWSPACGTAPSNLDQLIANGNSDAYINAWADGLKRFLSGPDGVYGNSDDRRVYIRFAHEMNGTWYPWSANSSGQTPWNYIAMWRHVHNIFAAKGLGAYHVQWVWCVNTKDSGGKYTAEQYYPGNTYVDWIGIDGYNFGNVVYGSNVHTWKTPAEVFDNMVGRMRNLAAKPIGFMETASSPYYSGWSIWAKSQWISNLYGYANSKGIKMVVWFNENPQTTGVQCCYYTHWMTFAGTDGDSIYTILGSTYQIYGEYKSTMDLWWLKGTSPTNPRLLTTSQFHGVL